MHAAVSQEVLHSVDPWLWNRYAARDGGILRGTKERGCSLLSPVRLHLHRGASARWSAKGLGGRPDGVGRFVAVGARRAVARASSIIPGHDRPQTSS
jgi:hypothetical protein